jgi:hypothetical protein
MHALCADRSGCHGFTAQLAPGGSRTNGSFILEPATGSGMNGYVGIAFAQVGQEFIVERSAPVEPPKDNPLLSDMWGVEVGDTMVYTLVFKEKK